MSRIGRRIVHALVGSMPVPLADLLRRGLAPGTGASRVRRVVLRRLYRGGIPRAVSSFRLVDNRDLEFVAADSQVLEQLYWAGEQGWEPELLPWWRAFCRNSRSVLELGTNVGYFAVQGARAAPAVRYVAVEPHPVSAGICRTHLALNGVTSVEVVEAAAVADPAATAAVLQVAADQAGSPTIAFLSSDTELPADMARDVVGVLDVPAVDVRHLLDGVDLIKLDVEGQEHVLLAAMREHLRERRPTLFVEVLPGTVQLRAMLAELCATLGYRCYAMSRRGLVELDGERLATIRLMDEFGCQDVLLSAVDIPIPERLPDDGNVVRGSGMAVAPPRGAARVIDELGRLLVGAPLPLSVRCWDGSESVVEGAPTLVVTHRRALRRLLYAPGELGLARAYVSGDLDVEGDIYAALSFADRLPARPELRLDRGALARLLPRLLRLGVLGPPPAPPPEEARLRGIRHSLRRDRDAISHHYDVGNDFYRLLLGPSLVYSCAYFPEPTATLEQAQEAKLDLVCRKLGLQPGMRLLDVGCGWGSLALHAADRYGASVTAVTISAAQAELAARRVAEAGLTERIEIRLQDYREVADGPYDAISSVGMAEHVGVAELPLYAARLCALLRPGGRLLNHAIARGPAAGTDRPDPGSFLTRYVFPDGELQPLATHVRVLEEAGLEVCDVEALRRHYALTCRAWVSNLEDHWDEAVRVTSPGRARVWRLYLAGSALAFEGHRVGVNQVLAVKPSPEGHEPMPLVRPGRAGTGERLWAAAPAPARPS